MMAKQNGFQLKQLVHVAEALPRIAYSAARHGALPLGVNSLKTLTFEGPKNLHFKIMGDFLVRTFQHSGPVLTKFGQILATRGDLLPEEVCLRLDALYSKQPPMPWRKVRRILHRAHPGRSPFKRFDRKALAVGSVGQVHRARLRDGKRVIVKMIRPGVAHAIERDMDAARVFVNCVFGMPGKSKKTTRMLMNKALDDLEQGFKWEVDLENEAKTLIDFRSRLKRNPNVYVPECYVKYSSRDILVMEELKGTPLSEYRRRAKKDPEVAKKVADLALKEILNQIFDDGRFHADPHAGNLLVLEDGRLGLIDLGLTGEFSDKDRRNISRAVKAFLSRDPDTVIKALLNFGTLPDDFDHEGFKADIVATVRANKAKVGAHLKGEGSGEESALEGFIDDLFKVSHKHRIYVPPSSTLLIKTLVTIEGVARSLNPELNLVTSALPVVMKALTPKWVRWALGGGGR